MEPRQKNLNDLTFAGTQYSFACKWDHFLCKQLGEFNHVSHSDFESYCRTITVLYTCCYSQCLAMLCCWHFYTTGFVSHGRKCLYINKNPWLLKETAVCYTNQGKLILNCNTQKLCIVIFINFITSTFIILLLPFKKAQTNSGQSSFQGTSGPKSPPIKLIPILSSKWSKPLNTASEHSILFSGWIDPQTTKEGSPQTNWRPDIFSTTSYSPNYR